MIDLCELARNGMRTWLRFGTKWDTFPTAGKRAACFVSLHTADGSLRGCIGTLRPQQPDLAGEVVENAIAAATRDHRFAAVTPEELEGLEIQVSVLTPPEPIAGPHLLDPLRYGVIVESGAKRGVLLPDLPGIESVAQQIEIASRKAGIGRDSKCKLWRFQVETHHESL